ncbi:hypothetical protein EMIT0P171_10259 [Pseudomonas sp. IT-P171]
MDASGTHYRWPPEICAWTHLAQGAGDSLDWLIAKHSTVHVGSVVIVHGGCHYRPSSRSLVCLAVF